MSNNGIIKRTYGGAVYNRLENQFSKETTYDVRLSDEREIKDKLARYAVEKYVTNNSVVLLEGGTTILSMINHMTEFYNLTVFTNGVNTLKELEKIDASCTIISCGGSVRRVHNTFVGPIMTNFFHTFHMQIGFFSTIGFDLNTGFTDADVLESQSKQAMAKACDKKIFLVQSSKFGVRSASPTFKTDEIDVLITDKDAPKDVLDTFQNMGIEVYIVE